MGFIFGSVFASAFLGAINALGVHCAAIFVRAEYPDYKQTFMSIFGGYIVFFLIIGVMIKTNHIPSNFLVC